MNFVELKILFHVTYLLLIVFFWTFHLHNWNSSNKLTYFSENSPTLSILLFVDDTSNQLEEMLISIRENTVYDHEVIIVSDNCRKQQKLEIVEVLTWYKHYRTFLNHKVIESHYCSKPNGISHYLKNFSGQYLAVFPNITTVENGWDKRVINTFEDKKNIHILSGYCYVNNSSDCDSKNNDGNLNPIFMRNVFEKINNYVGAEADEQNKHIITGCNYNHFNTLRNLFKSIIEHEPSVKVIVIDLGLSKEQISEIESWNIYLLIRFEYELYPSYMDIRVNRGEYAWKSVSMFNILVDHPGTHFWLDSGDKILKPLTKTWKKIENRVYSTCTEENIKSWTHPGMLKVFDVINDDSILTARNCNGATVGVDSRNSDTLESIFYPWVFCSLMKECISPQGASRLNHRQDQAALSILMAKYGYECDPDDGMWFGEAAKHEDSEISVHNDVEGDAASICIIDGREYEKC